MTKYLTKCDGKELSELRCGDVIFKVTRNDPNNIRKILYRNEHHFTIRNIKGDILKLEPMCDDGYKWSVGGISKDGFLYIDLREKCNKLQMDGTFSHHFYNHRVDLYTIYKEHARLKRKYQQTRSKIEHKMEDATKNIENDDTYSIYMNFFSGNYGKDLCAEADSLYKEMMEARRLMNEAFHDNNEAFTGLKIDKDEKVLDNPFEV